MMNYYERNFVMEGLIVGKRLDVIYFTHSFYHDRSGDTKKKKRATIVKVILKVIVKVISKNVINLKNLVLVSISKFCKPL